MSAGSHHLALEHAERSLRVDGIFGDLQVEQSAALRLALDERALVVDAPQESLGSGKHQCAEFFAPVSAWIERLRRAFQLAQSSEPLPVQ